MVKIRVYDEEAERKKREEQRAIDIKAKIGRFSSAAYEGLSELIVRLNQDPSITLFVPKKDRLFRIVTGDYASGDLITDVAFGAIAIPGEELSLGFAATAYPRKRPRPSSHFKMEEVQEIKSSRQIKRILEDTSLYEAFRSLPLQAFDTSFLHWFVKTQSSLRYSSSLSGNCWPQLIKYREFINSIT